MYAGNIFVLHGKFFTLKSLLKETEISSAYKFFYATCKQVFTRNRLTRLLFRNDKNLGILVLDVLSHFAFTLLNSFYSVSFFSFSAHTQIPNSP